VAKRIPSGAVALSLDFIGGEHKLGMFHYGTPDDDTDPTIRYVRTGSPPAERALTVDELSGTLQAFIDARLAEAQAAEGIS